VGNLNGEEETRKLLKFRGDIEERIKKLEVEIEDLRKAISEIDKTIVKQGFRQPILRTHEVIEKIEKDSDNRITIKSREGVTLGHLQIEENVLIFKPIDSINFQTSIPPFQSFLLERVLGNMRATDEEKAVKDQLSLNEVLSFDVSTEEDKITAITILNYGGDRRLREIQSSIRWAFEKMYEKIIQSR
jgi:hypothetical protein